MNLLERVKNRKGTITVFFVIIMSAVLWGFFFLCTAYSVKMGESTAINYMNCGNDGILSSPDEYILRNYGLACYDSKESEDIAENIIYENYKIMNEGASRFYELALQSNGVEYTKLKSIDDYDELKKQIMKYESFQSAEEFGSWIIGMVTKTKEADELRKKISDKTKLGDKMMKLYDYKKELNSRIYDIAKKHVKEIKRIEHMTDEDLPKIYSKLNSLIKDNKDALALIRKMKSALSEFDEGNELNEELAELREKEKKLMKNISMIDNMQKKNQKRKYGRSGF